MLTIGIVEDDIDALINVIRNLMVLERSRYEFDMVPVLLSDPGIDTPEAIQGRAVEYGVNRLREAGIATGDWPAIVQKGMLCPVDEKERAEILQYLAARNVDAIICDSWLGRGKTALESKFGEKALKLAGLMLLDDAEKEERWRGKCWIMTMYQGDVFEQLKALVAGDGWRPEKFNLLARFLQKDLINATHPSKCHLQLERVVDECLARVTFAKPAELPAEESTKETFGSLVGRSQPMLAVYEKIQKVAQRNVPVVIQGETGVGKELVACEIHRNSLRLGPFVPVDCGAIPAELMESELFGHAKGGFTGAVKDKAGLFEEANGGTIFLDEIGNLPITMQMKLLRVLQEGQLRRVGSNKLISFDARVLAASNKDLEQEVREGRFKEDLYYRISGFEIRIPSLRERRGDVAVLCDHFLRKENETMPSHAKEISADAVETLDGFSWPGNVRQLKNVISRAITYVESEGIITSSNEAIAEIARLLQSQPPLAPARRDEQSAAAGSASPLYRDMSAPQIWALIKDGKVTKTLPQWVKAIGAPKTLEVVDEVIHYCHGHLPTDGETQKYFGQKYRAWNGCRLRYLKGEPG